MVVILVHAMSAQRNATGIAGRCARSLSADSRRIPKLAKHLEDPVRCYRKGAQLADEPAGQRSSPVSFEPEIEVLGNELIVDEMRVCSTDAVNLGSLTR